MVISHFIIIIICILLEWVHGTALRFEFRPCSDGGVATEVPCSSEHASHCKSPTLLCDLSVAVIVLCGILGWMLGAD